MRRSIALFVSATAVLVAASAAAAQPVAPTPRVALLDPRRDGSGRSRRRGRARAAQVTGPGSRATLDAGASEEHDLVVSNHTANLRLTVKLTATDATGGRGAGAAAWLAFGTDVVQLDPHAAMTVPMTIAVPHDTQPGSALAHVIATVESAVVGCRRQSASSASRTRRSRSRSK